MTPNAHHRALIAALSASVLCLGSCGTPVEEEVESETVVSVKTEAASLGTIRGLVHATGVVRPAPGAELVVVAPEAARIAEVPKGAGDPVRRGDVLVRFEIPQSLAEVERQQAEIARAQAALTNARAAQTRAADLFERGVAPRKEVEETTRASADAEAGLAQARASLAAAETVAARATVRATFNGIVARRQHNPGDLVEPTATDEVLRVIDPDRLEVVASVPISDASRITVGAAAHLVSAQTDGPKSGLRVLSRPVSVDAGTATIPVRLGFSPATKLADGTPVQVEIEAELHSNVVLVPTVAVVREGDETAVFVAAGGKAERRPVELGLNDGTHVEIVSGLKAGEAVIVDGQAGLPDGAAIKVGNETTAADKPETDNAPEKDRGEVNIAATALRHSRAAALLAAALVISGVMAAFALPSGIYPPLQFPRIVIVAHSGTLPPQSMSLIVTRPIEQVVMAVPGVRRVRSRSIRGASETSAQFDPSTDMVVALQMVQNRVAEIGADLPRDTELQIERMTPEIFPVFILSLTGALPTADLYDYANFVVKPEIARVPGAGIIEVLASDTREIEVVLDPGKLAAANLTVVDVADALKTQNTILPVGRFQESGLQHLALASGLWKNAEQIADAPVKVTNGAAIRVSDIGSVTRGTPDRTQLVTGSGRDAVSISIAQQLGANILDLKAGLDAVVTSLATTLPAGIGISRVYDLAEFVEESIASVRDAILIGGFLAIVVLLVFLRDWRLTMIAAVTLPMAVIPTFVFMWLFGGTINLMSMGGLAVAIGLVIDDAVVVVENVHRRAGEGGSSVVDAVQQLLAPLVSSTLTTVVVFAPLGLLSGVPGQFFRALSLSLSVAVLVSLALSISIVPLMARWAVAHHRPTGESHGAMDRAYGRLLGIVVGRPVVAVAIALLLATLTGVLFLRVGTGFFPAADEGGFVLDYLTPAGSALSETDRQVRVIERVVADTPEVASYSRRTGSELGLFATAQNSGDILVRLKPRGQRSRSSEEIISDVRERVHQAAPLVEIEFVQLLQDMLGDLEGNPEPIEVKIFGDDPDRLAELAGPVEEMIGKVEGVVDVVGVQEGNPEVTWTINPTAAGRYGLSVDQVSNQMAGNWLGEVATDLRLADRTIPVRVRLPDSIRLNPNRLAETLLRTADGKPIPVSEVATMERANGQGELRRENLRAMAVVSGRLEGRDLGSAVAEIRSNLDALKLPIGNTYEIGGQYQAQGQAFRELLMVFALAIVLVFMILVIQFRAWLPAILILLAAPLSLGGALLLLWLASIDLNISSAMGLILLVGLVVKNGIMLLDFSEKLHADGEPFDAAIAHAGRIRLRPILMTTFCTLFGLLPLALGLGAGAELQKPLALAVIGGLALSTPVTLLAIPGLYAAIKGTK